MKGQALKAKDDSSFWSSAKRRNLFFKINDSVKYSLQKWIIYHLHVIKYPIVNYYITFKFDDGIIVVKTEIHQKVILQVSVCELHIDKLKKYATGFSMAYDEKGLVRISNYDL